MRTTRILTGWAALCLLATPLSAAPFQPGDVSADAKWIVHVDFDAAHASKIGERFRERIMKEDEKAREKLAKLKEEFGIDPREDLHGATMYSDKFQRHQGVLIVRVDFDREKLIAKAKHLPDYKQHEYGDHVISTWTREKGKEAGQTVAGAAIGDEAVVFASSVELAKQALDVLDGKKTGLAEDSPLAAKTRKGTIFLARAVGMNEADDLPAKSPVLRNSSRLSLAVGERKGRLFLTGLLAPESPETARQVADVIGGFRAMVLLKHGSDDAVRKVMDGLQVKATDAEVRVRWKAAVDDVVKAGKTLRTEHKEHRKRLRELRKKRRDAGGDE